jgi:hypothetical protein
VAAALAVAVLGTSAGAASAAPDRGDGPAGHQSSALDRACQAAFDTMEWAKSKRRQADDVYDRIANAAFWFLDNYCDGADYDSSTSSAPPASIAGAWTAIDEARAVVGIEPVDNPVPPLLAIEPVDDPIPWYWAGPGG